VILLVLAAGIEKPDYNQYAIVRAPERLAQ
jgi:hypothetical protein